MQLALMYFAICLVYFLHTGDGAMIAVVLCAILSSLIYWRVNSFFDWEVYGDDLLHVGKISGIILAIVSSIMTVRARGMKSELDHHRACHAFCEANPSFVWKQGTPAPE